MHPPPAGTPWIAPPVQQLLIRALLSRVRAWALVRTTNPHQNIHP